MSLSALIYNRNSQETAETPKSEYAQILENVQQYMSQEHGAALSQAPMKKMKVVNCQSYVNLRAEATAKSESLAQLTLGTEVEATGNVSGGFIEVIYMGMKGFVAEDYLAEQK